MIVTHSSGYVLGAKRITEYGTTTCSFLYQEAMMTIPSLLHDL